MKNSDFKVYAALALTGLFWGANFHFAKIAVQFFTPVSAATIRFTIAGILLLLLVIITRQYSKKDLVNNLPIFAFLSILGVYGYNILFFSGMKTSSTVTGALINATNPLMTVVISHYILKTQIRAGQLAGIILSFLGIVGVITKGDWHIIATLKFVPGDLMILTATLLFGFFNVYTRRDLSKVSPILTTTVVTVFSAVLFIITSFFDTGFTIQPVIPVYVWLAIAAMSVFGSVIAYIFWNYGIARIGADRASVFMNLVPLSAAFISFFTGEKITPIQIAGGLCILTGVAIATALKAD